MIYALQFIALTLSLPICTEPWFPIVFESKVEFASFEEDRTNGNLVMVGWALGTDYAQYDNSPAFQMTSKYGAILWAKVYKYKST